MMSRISRIIIGLIVVAGVVILGLKMCMGWGIEESNPHNYATIGDIPTPAGYERITGKDAGYVKFMRSLPLKPTGAVVKYYIGGVADLQDLNYAVVDMPLLSNAEQCADVCMRVWAEYLYQAGRASEIHFLDVQGHIMKYSGEQDRETFEDYLRDVFDVANTYSLCQEMSIRKLDDIQPGDVFVYPAPDSNHYGHAVMVADVAKDPSTGIKAIMLLEGYTPARSIHVMQNWQEPSHSPWFILDDDSGYFTFSPFQFKASDLKYFSQD